MTENPPRNAVSCPRCQHEFVPSKPDPRAPLWAMVSAFHDHTDGRPRTSQQLHADFLTYAHGRGFDDPFLTSRIVTARLMHAHGWGWHRAADGRRYYPPGNRPYTRPRAVDVDRLLPEWLQTAGPGTATAEQLNTRFRDWCRHTAGAPADFRPPPGWLTGQLVDRGWTIRRTNRGRLVCPPA